METWIVLAVIGGLVAGAVVGLVIGRLWTLAAANQKMVDARAELASAQAQRDAARQQLVEGAQSREALVNQFKALSSEILAEQSRRADVTADDRLKRTEALMAPVSQNLTALQEKLGEVEQQRISISAEMRQQVNNVVVMAENLRRETNQLATALRKPQVRGSWGETQLRRVVEMAGMVDHVDFIEQDTTQSSEGAALRPDLKVMLGDGKFCYVDSKVPLEAFLDAQASDNDEDRAAHFERFAGHVRKHIQQLSSKSYWKADRGSPEFVALFIPTESLYAEALTQDPTLIDYAMENHIVLTNPTNLIGLLWVVAYGWKQSQLADTAAEAVELSQELHSRIARLGTLVDGLGKSLSGSVDSYNKMVGSLEHRVLPAARQLGKLQIANEEITSPRVLDGGVRALNAPELIEDTLTE